MFEKSLTFWRILLPRTEPFGNSRRNRKKLKALIEETKELVQSLNDGFSQAISEQPSYAPPTESQAMPQESVIPEPKPQSKSAPAPFYPGPSKK